MLIPVRVVVEVVLTTPQQGEQKRHTFYKDTKLPQILFLLKPGTPVQLSVGEEFRDFRLDRDKPPPRIEEKRDRVVVFLQTLWDKNGAMTAKLHETWSAAKDSTDAADFAKTPELPKTKRVYKKKNKGEGPPTIV